MVICFGAHGQIAILPTVSILPPWWPIVLWDTKAQREGCAHWEMCVQLIVRP